ncbi:uncharacterized protein LOC111397851 [Olea europaea var. sylvestris]|uniref:uncharacterized protein LOC111397851 n=1 Tax=Olea europaea var. sylvestris TaxID=158386 RepID=UPI000C1D2891|nr:uncharacterized protein LOC111397851 [Olea europaea var. sylvestris]
MSHEFISMLRLEVLDIFSPSRRELGCQLGLQDSACSALHRLQPVGPQPPIRSAAPGIGIRVVIKPEYKITPSPPFSPHGQHVGEISQSHFHFDLKFERIVLAEAVKENPNRSRLGLETVPPKPTDSTSYQSKNNQPPGVVPDCLPKRPLATQVGTLFVVADAFLNGVALSDRAHLVLKIFSQVDDTTGLGLVTELQKALIKFDLDIDDIRGQMYDNGSNMSEKHKDVQKRVHEMIPRAFYTPCGAHSPNLALCDMVNCCSKVVSFFGVIQRIYTLFFSSTER